MFFVGIYKCPVDLKGEHELVSVCAKDLSENDAEKLVVETNNNLGIKMEPDGYSFIVPPGNLCAMYDHMEDLPKGF
jgi:hypothetical protein